MKTMDNTSQHASENKENPLRHVFGSVDLRRVMPGLIVAALLSNLLGLAFPLAILQIMNRIVVNKSVDTLIFLVVGVIMALILEEILRSLNGVVTAWLGVRFEQNMTVEALSRLMRVPMRLYQREEPSAYLEKVLSSSKVAEYYSGHALLFLLDIPFIIIFLILIGVIGGWLVLVPIVILLIFSFVMSRYAVRIRNQIRNRHVIDDSRFNFIAEVLSNIQSVKILTAEALMQRRYERLQETNAEMVENLVNGNLTATNMRILFSQIMIIGVIYAGVWIVLPGGMTPGALAACMLLSIRALQPLLRSLSAWLKYQSFLDAHQRLDEVMEMPYQNDQDKPSLPPAIESLELRDINLCFEGLPPLFSDLSLVVKAGECIAIQGGSGSGKTSLLSLMNGISQPDSGSVLVDGHSLMEFAVDSIHKEIAFLPQSGAVVAGTILENMTMFDNSLNSLAIDIAEKLGLDKIVGGMKLGYETNLSGITGETLPDGVGQIITIIRALVHYPSIILFDEANIALDMVSDRKLRDYLGSLKGKCTVVLVTHRPSILSLADKVYSLEEGKLVEGSLETSPENVAELSADIEASIEERPESIGDISAVLSHQIAEESDLSVCLIPLLDSLGWMGRPRELAEAMPHIVRRLDLSGLCSLLSNLGFTPNHSESDLSRIDYRLLPCLFVPADKPAKLITEKLPDGRLKIFDGGLREEVEIDAYAEKGEIYLFRQPEKTAISNRPESSWFGSLFWSFRRHIALAFVISIISALLSLAPPLFVMSIYNNVLPTGDVVMGGYLLLGVGIAMVVAWFLRELKGRVMAYLGARLEYILGSSVFQRVIGLPITSIEGVSVSRQVGRIKGLEGLREFFLGPLATLIFDIPSILIMLVAIYIIAPPLMGIVAISIVVYGALGLVSRGMSKKAVSQSSVISSLRWDVLSEALTHMRAIRLVGSTHLWVNRFKNLNAKTVLANFRNQQLQARITGITQVIGTSTALCILAAAAVMAIRHGLTGGAMLAAMMIVWRVTGPVQNVFLSATSIVRIRGTMNQIENLVKLKGESDGGVIQSIRPELHGEIVYSRVSFRYASDADPALLGVTFSVVPGQVVVITGANGAGKSTLLKLLARVYSPQAGTIRMDYVDIRQLNMADHRSRISYMPQNVELFYGSITQNLLLSYPSATDAELRWAVDMAGLTNDIQALPQGFETRVSNSRSEMLPQGFRQRLSLARTILKPASVVLLDEPGTGMDKIGEDALLRCIEYLRRHGSTVLIVSHRPSHMRLADTVIYMERGSVAAMGAFDQIMNKVMAGLQS